MNKTKFLAIAALALVLLNLGTIAFFMMKRPPHPMQDGPKQVIVDRLRFDAQQVAAYEKLILQHQQDVNAKTKEIGAARKALFELLKSDDLSKKDSLTTAIGKLQQQIETIHFQHFSDIKKLCKGEQMQAFNDLTSDLANYFSPKHKGK